MSEIAAYTLGQKDPISVQFSGEIYGVVGLKKELLESVRWLPITLGIALELTGRVRSVSSEFRHWYKFQARSMGYMASMVKMEQELIFHWAEKNPGLIVRSYAEIWAEADQELRLRRRHRPFARFFDSWANPVEGIVFGHAPDGRIGVYLGVDGKGLGGYVRYFEKGDVHEEPPRDVIRFQ